MIEISTQNYDITENHVQNVIDASCSRCSNGLLDYKLTLLGHNYDTFQPLIATHMYRRNKLRLINVNF